MTNEHAADLGLPREVAQDSGEATGTHLQPEASAVDDCGGLSGQQYAAYIEFMTTLEDMDR